MNNSKWIKISQGDYSFFVRRETIKGVFISEDDVLSLAILTTGDEGRTKFTFNTKKERDSALSDITSL